MNQMNNIAINLITGNLLGNLVLNGDSYKYSHQAACTEVVVHHLPLHMLQEFEPQECEM